MYINQLTTYFAVRIFPLNDSECLVSLSRYGPLIRSTNVSRQNKLSKMRNTFVQITSMWLALR